MQWDDLRYVLAVHRAGSLAGAARAMSVSNVTVFRRIEAIEKTLGCRLFDRKRNGYVATGATEDIVREAERIEEQINSLERRVWRQDAEIRGTVRLTVTDTMGTLVLPRILRELRRRHSQIEPDLLIVNEILNITKRDADIAIRPTNAPPEMLVGHKLGLAACAVYASRRLVPPRRAQSVDLTSLPWVTFDDTFAAHRFARWVRDNGYEPHVVFRTNTFLGMASAISAGLGAGVVSCFTASQMPGLVRISPLLRDIESYLWILTHPELRNVARVAAVYAFLRETFVKLRPQLAGEKP